MNKIKDFLKKEWMLLLFIIFSFGIGLYFAPQLPEQIPIHWNINGEVDGFGPKIWGIIGFPLISLGIYILMLLLPFIDPKKKNYSLFEGTYKIIRLVLVLFFVLMHIISVLVAIGYDLKMDKLVVMLVAILFIILGNYFGKVRQNWFVGIKTPWTLSSTEVWNKTHRLAGRLWVATGIAIMFTIFINPILTFVLLISAAFFPILYSYYLYKKMSNEKSQS